MLGSFRVIPDCRLLAKTLNSAKLHNTSANPNVYGWRKVVPKTAIKKQGRDDPASIINIKGMNYIISKVLILNNIFLFTSH